MGGRILGVDYGQRRIGLAVSDALGITAQPAGTVEVSGPREALAAVDAAAEAHEAAHIVIGLPKSLSGDIGPKARETIRFAAYYQRTSAAPVSLWDERLTTVSAERVLDEAGVSGRRRRGRVDALAAQVMLQSYLDAQRQATRGDSSV